MTYLHFLRHLSQIFLNFSPNSSISPVFSINPNFSTFPTLASEALYHNFSSDSQTHHSDKYNFSHFLLIILQHRMICSIFALCTQWQMLTILILLHNSALRHLLFYGFIQLSCSLLQITHLVLFDICCHECYKSNVYNSQVTFTSSALPPAQLISLFEYWTPYESFCPSLNYNLPKPKDPTPHFLSKYNFLIGTLSPCLMVSFNWLKIRFSIVFYYFFSERFYFIWKVCFVRIILKNKTYNQL